MRKCCLVIGAGGFIGFNLACQLKETYEKVYVCDTYFHEGIYKQLQQSNVEFIEGGVKRFTLNLEHYQDITHIFYFAGSATPALIETELGRGYFSDQESLLMVLEACKELPTLIDLTYASSGGTVYGLSDSAHKESSQTAPISAYGLSKLIQEKYVAFYAKRIGFKEKIVRISNPYGRSSTHHNKTLQGFIDVTISKVLSNTEVEIWGDGKVVRDFIHINDLITGIISLSPSDIPAGIYNIGHGQGHSLNQVINHLKELNTAPNIKYLDSRGIDVPISILDIHHIKNVTGWEPKIPLKKGIEKVLKKIHQH